MIRTGFAALALALALTDDALAAQRTFVASAGNDLNACSIAQPCRGFARAISQTDAGGEVLVLDSAGYGPVVINQAVSIIAPPGVYAGISVFSGIGVAVAITSNQTVTLKGLTIAGLGGAIGISLTTNGTLNIVDCTVRDMTQDGIAITPSSGGRVLISGTTVSNNASHGIVATASFSGTLFLTLDRLQVMRNGFGASGYGIRLTGVAASFNNATIRSSLIAENQTGLRTEGPGNEITAFVVDTTFAQNTQSLSVGAGTEVFLERVSAQTSSSNIANSGTIRSFGNNAILDGITGSAIQLLTPK